jgi:hypothetical protein
MNSDPFNQKDTVEETTEQNGIDEPVSELEQSLKNVEIEMQNMKKDVIRLKRMDDALTNVVESTIFTKNEKQIYMNSYHKLKTTLQENVQQKRMTNIVNCLNESKRLWEEKQRIMFQMQEDGLLDNEVRL